jgi:predicted nucleotidyltransferase
MAPVRRQQRRAGPATLAVISGRTRKVIDRVARRLVSDGAQAVVLTGSHARGAATDDSDIDVTAIGEGPAYRMEVVDGELFSIAWRTVDGERAAMRDPARAGAAVPAWRSVEILHDPSGVASVLVTEARAWDWALIDDACDRWVAEEAAGYAEEVHKLVAARRRGDDLGTAVQRSVLALRLGPIMAVWCRLLYESENELWHLLADRLGEPWASTQRKALALDGADHAAATEAALRLYAIVAQTADPLLDDRQRAVVRRALNRIDA